MHPGAMFKRCKRLLVRFFITHSAHVWIQWPLITLPALSVVEWQQFWGGGGGFPHTISTAATC
jgi:hypothetical protein